MTNSILSPASSRQDSISVIYAALGNRSNHSRALARASSRGRQKVSRRQAPSARARALRLLATRAARSIGLLLPTAIEGPLIPFLFERDSSRSIPRKGAGAHSRFGHKA